MYFQTNPGSALVVIQICSCNSPKCPLQNMRILKQNQGMPFWKTHISMQLPQLPPYKMYVCWYKSSGCPLGNTCTSMRFLKITFSRIYMFTQFLKALLMKFGDIHILTQFLKVPPCKIICRGRPFLNMNISTARLAVKANCWLWGLLFLDNSLFLEALGSCTHAKPFGLGTWAQGSWKKCIF